jgi:hypothetical protein
MDMLIMCQLGQLNSMDSQNCKKIKLTKISQSLIILQEDLKSLLIQLLKYNKIKEKSILMIKLKVNKIKNYGLRLKKKDYLILFSSLVYL